MPALLTVSASEAINLFRSKPSILTDLQANIRSARQILDRVDLISIPSHPASPIIHIYIKTPGTFPTSYYTASSTATPGNPSPGGGGAGNTNMLHPLTATLSSSSASKPSNPASVLPRDAAHWTWDIKEEERVLQDVVDEALAQGVLLTKAHRLRGQEMIEPRPSIRLALTSALTNKETVKAVEVVKAALVKVLSKRKL